MREKFIPLSIPSFGGNEWKYVKECFNTGWVSSAGPFVNRFEKAVSGYVGISHAVAVSSGTAALHVALLAVGVQPDDEVIVSTLSFAAPANAVFYCRAHPVFMDADPKTWQMDVAKLEKFLNEECKQRKEGCFNKKSGRRIRAILPVHILGSACEMDKIMGLARQFGLKVVEDACQGMGVRYQEQHVGTFGDAAALSFNGNKIVTAGGGGMVITNDKSTADYVRYLTTQAKDDPLEYFHKEIGYNYRLTNVQAAIGLAQLEQLEKFLEKKRSIASFYKEAFGAFSGLSLMPEQKSCHPTFWLHTVLLGTQTTLVQRKAFIQSLNRQGINARSLWHTLHDLPCFASAQSYQIEFAVSLYHRAVSLPSSVGLMPEELESVVDAFQRELM